MPPPACCLCQESGYVDSLCDAVWRLLDWGAVPEVAQCLIGGLFATAEGEMWCLCIVLAARLGQRLACLGHACACVSCVSCSSAVRVSCRQFCCACAFCELRSQLACEAAPWWQTNFCYLAAVDNVTSQCEVWSVTYHTAQSFASLRSSPALQRLRRQVVQGADVSTFIYSSCS